MRPILISTVILSYLLSCSTAENNYYKKVDLNELNIFIDSWHQAAAVADEETFFGSMDSNAVYLGTDPGERWLKHEFMAWGMKYFQRDTAWAFTPYNRVWELTEDGHYAWFDELLETHMGICRGSGVIKRYGNKCKIKHYNLALTLPNEKMNEFRLLYRKTH